MVSPGIAAQTEKFLMGTDDGEMVDFLPPETVRDDQSQVPLQELEPHLQMDRDEDYGNVISVH